MEPIALSVPEHLAVANMPATDTVGFGSPVPNKFPVASNTGNRGNAAAAAFADGENVIVHTCPRPIDRVVRLTVKPVPLNSNFRRAVSTSWAEALCAKGVVVRFTVCSDAGSIWLNCAVKVPKIDAWPLTISSTTIEFVCTALGSQGLNAVVHC